MVHKAVVTATGAAGGATGLAGAAIELPISTAIMLRSIADIARGHGEDLRSDEVSLSCLQCVHPEGPTPVRRHEPSWSMPEGHSAKYRRISIRNLRLRTTWQSSRREAARNFSIAKTMVEELLARTRLEMSHIVSALEAVRGLLANVETVDATRDTAAGMIGILNEALVRLRDELDMRQVGNEASNIVELSDQWSYRR
jgi:hypothetical protein